MRRIFPSLALAMLPFLAATAQDSRCNPCVDPPTNRIRRDNWVDINSPVPRTTITAEEMRNLGVISVAEMVSQLPSNASVSTSPYDRPVALGDVDGFPDQFAPAFAAAAGHLASLEHEPAEFNARLVSCIEDSCALVIYPGEIGDASAVTIRECPATYCATMIYSLPQDRILEIREMRSDEVIRP